MISISKVEIILKLLEINTISDAKRVNTCDFNRTHIFSNAGPSSPGTKEKGTSFPPVMITAQCSRKEHLIIPPPLCQSHMKPDFYKPEIMYVISQN